MLEPWAMRFKNLKKRVAWSLYQHADLENASRLHATSGAEAANLADLQLMPRVEVVANGMELPKVLQSEKLDKAHPGGLRTALFLGRLHPKKGLPLLIDAWAEVRPRRWRLIIAGPDEDGHSGEVAALIQRRGLTGDIRLVGPAYADEKAQLLASARVFVLPTYSENFGMAVAEALANGVPVITTTSAPWQELHTSKCGWWIPPERDALADALRSACAASEASLCEMGRRGRELIRSQYSWSKIAGRMACVYKTCLLDRVAANAS